MNRLLAIAVVSFGCALPANAVPITYLHHFSSEVDHGLGPQGGVAISGGRLFGGTRSNSSGGTIYSLNIDGSNYQMLHEFPVDGSDGISPVGKPIVVGTTVFGVTESSFAPHQGGTIWAIETDGSNFRLIHSFGEGFSGAGVLEGMSYIGNRLYGTTNAGGVAPYLGVLYSLKLDGSDYQVLHNFTGGDAGRRPAAAPTQVAVRIYGTSGGGGTYDGGIVYSIQPDGTDFQIVHSFPFEYTPTAGVVAIGDRLYGATTGGGQNGRGTVYAVNVDGSDFEFLHEFNGLDGFQASRDLVTDGTRLYGTTFSGVVYSLLIDGSGFEVLHRFVNNDDDQEPSLPNALLLSGSILYGTTESGGLYEGGTVFAIEVPEPSMVVLGVIGTIGLCVVSIFRIRFSQRRQDDETAFIGKR